MAIESKAANRPITARVPEETVRAIDVWRRSNPGHTIPRGEAIRQLIELGLAVDARPKV